MTVIKINGLNLHGQVRAANEAAERAEEAARDAVDISNIEVPDDVVEALMKGTAGAGPKTRAVLADLTVARVSPTKHAPALNLYFPEAEGAVADGVTDCTAAIQAAIDACPAGGRVWFGATGPVQHYKITGTLEIAEFNIEFAAAGKDAYGSYIQCSVPGVTMVVVKGSGFKLGITLWGDGAANGAGATTVGVDFYGDTDGNIDGVVTAPTVIFRHAVGVRSRGRNLTVDDDALVTDCLKGVLVSGPDAVYHTGPNADQIRGHYIGGRYHGCGNTATDAAIEVDDTAGVIHMIIAPSQIDSTRKGRGIVVTGTAALPSKGITIDSGKITEAAADAIVLTYVWNSTILPQQIHGDTVATTYGHGIVLDNCNNIDVYQPSCMQVGKSGIKITASTEIRVRQPRVKVCGLDTSQTYDAINIGNTCTDIEIDDPYLRSATGYGIGGNPNGSRVRGGEFVSNALGAINSTTLINQTNKGLNTYTEGEFGRGEDRARKAVDLAAGVATDVATITGGGNFSSFFVRVRFSARAGGSCYVAAERVVFTENGTPSFVTVGTDATNLCTIAFTANGSTSVKVTLTATNAASGVVMVETYGAGASNTTNPRSAQVTMI